MRRLYYRALVATLAPALLCACGATTPIAAQPSPTVTPLSGTPSSQPSPLFTSSPLPLPVPSPGAPSTTPTIVSAVAAGDTLTLTFDRGTSGFAVKPQPSSHFLAGSGRGTWVNVAGSVGAEITLSGLRGDIRNYAGPTSINSQGPLLLEVLYVSFMPAPETGCASDTVAA